MERNKETLRKYLTEYQYPGNKIKEVISGFVLDKPVYRNTIENGT